MSSDASTYVVLVTAVEAMYKAGGDFDHEITSSKQKGGRRKHC